MAAMEHVRAGLGLGAEPVQSEHVRAVDAERLGRPEPFVAVGDAGTLVGEPVDETAACDILPLGFGGEP
ncbi:hypothetical protein GCM10009527_043070 [Actinomadura nitritigenes]